MKSLNLSQILDSGSSPVLKNQLNNTNLFEDIREKIRVSTIFYYSGISIILFLSLLFIFTQVSFFLKISVNVGFLFLSIFVTLSTIFCSLYRFQFKSHSISRNITLSLITILIISGLCFLFFMVSIHVSSNYIDEANDSNYYHTPYSYYFSHGWNPVLGINPHNLGDIEFFDPKENSYPKGIELIASYVYILTNSLESVKSINWLLFFPAYAITFQAFSLLFAERKIYAILVSTLAVFNPIWITQAFQFYIDGCLSELLLISISLIIILIKTNENFLELVTFVAVVTLTLNSKGSSLLYVPLILALFFVLIYLYKNEVLKFIPYIVVVLCLLFGITAYSPYITNYLSSNSLLGSEFATTSSELFTQDNVGYSNQKIPGWLVPKELFILSLFASPSQHFTGLNNPFSISLTDLLNMSGENRINGFGPMMGLITILTIISLLFLVGKAQSENAKILCICIFFIFSSVILHSACWWERFVPQFYFIPIFVAAIGLMSNKRIVKTIAAILIFCLLINMILIGYVSHSRAEFITEQFNTSISDIETNALYPVLLKNTIKGSSDKLFSPVASVLLNERGIQWKKWEPNSNLRMYPMKDYIYFYTDVYCVPKFQYVVT